MFVDIFDLGVVVPPANEAFDGVECVSWVGDGLAAGGHADEAGAVVGEGYDGGGCACSLGVFNYAGSPSFLFMYSCIHVFMYSLVVGRWPLVVGC